MGDVYHMSTKKGRCGLEAIMCIVVTTSRLTPTSGALPDRAETPQLTGEETHVRGKDTATCSEGSTIRSSQNQQHDFKKIAHQ
jgi:hypothetical protein